jgi:hypothetical protein
MRVLRGGKKRREDIPNDITQRGLTIVFRAREILRGRINVCQTVKEVRNEMDSDSSIKRDQPYNVVCGAMPRCQPAPSRALGTIYPDVSGNLPPQGPHQKVHLHTIFPYRGYLTARVARTGTGKAPTAEQRIKWTLGTGHWTLDTGHY